MHIKNSKKNRPPLRHEILEQEQDLTRIEYQAMSSSEFQEYANIETFTDKKKKKKDWYTELTEE